MSEKRSHLIDRLHRWRQFQQDRQALALCQQTTIMNEADKLLDERRAEVRDVETWKEEAGEQGRLDLGLYLAALDVEAHARDALADAERGRQVQHGQWQDCNSALALAASAVKVVDARRRRTAADEARADELLIADVISDLLSARRGAKA